MNLELNTIKEKIENCILSANDLKSKLTIDILNIHGYTSERIRHLLNNIGNAFPNTNYLEIGTWKGATLMSSIYNNSYKNIYAIDNWSEFEGPKDEFYSNTGGYKNIIKFYEQDCFTFDLNNIKEPIDIYFYDGNHDQESQYKALTYYNSALSETFILFVDDWEFDKVENGTRDAIKDLNYTIVNEWELMSDEPEGIWWHGFYVAIISK